MLVAGSTATVAPDDCWLMANVDSRPCSVRSVRMSVVVRDASRSAAHSSEFEYESASLCVTNRSAVNVYARRCMKRGDADDTTAPGAIWKKKSLSRAGPPGTC